MYKATNNNTTRWMNSCATARRSHRLLACRTQPSSRLPPLLGPAGSTSGWRLAMSSTCTVRPPPFCLGSLAAIHPPGRSYASSLSSFAEPDPTLFGPHATRASPDDSSTSSNNNNNNNDVNAQLRADIRVMGSLLGKVVQEHEGPELFAKVEELRHLAKTWREAKNRNNADQSVAESFAKMAQFVKQLSHEELYKVSRSFTHFLAIANAAESHHRARRVQHDVVAGHAKPDSCAGAIPALLQQGHAPEQILQALATQTTELVLTAHPTEVNRRAILEKKRRIQKILTKADSYRASGNGSAFALQQLDDALHREISSLWLSDEVARLKPTPEKEAEKGTLVLETVLWEALPQWMRKLDDTCRRYLGRSLPLTAAPVRLASWMGGDRDGNPNVTPNTTRHVCLRNRQKAATLLYHDLQRLESELSITTCSKELRAVVGDDDAREPYRAYLHPMMAKMERTIQWAADGLAALQQQQQQQQQQESPTDATPVQSIHRHKSDIYLSTQEFLDELLLMHRSLVDTNNEIIADGLLMDLLRKVSAFGLALVPLDVRQESDRHEEALDAITRYLGLGRYAQWDEETKVAWLTNQISGKRPLLRPGVWRNHPDVFSPTACDTLEIMQMIAEQPEGSLGAYVISQATSASDVLAVLLLQLDAGVQKPLRVAPLFETLNDLKGAGDTMKKLFSLPVYMGVIHGKQEVMIGYSDSAKDAGRLAAVWAQYETQEALSKIAKEYNVDMTFFHGKGGTIGRGGNPQTFLAIMAHTPNTINGKFRVTEQGEMIEKNLGFVDRAERTMDIYTAAVLSEKLTERPSPPASFRKLMDTLSELSCAAYRSIVRGDERFVPYFRSVTPEQELPSLNIGSRPAKRKATGGVESLRAIPYIFSWAQVRYNVPVWLGVSAALHQVLQDPDQAPLLRDMYRDFDSFRTMVDMIEMILAKSEPAIAKHYEDTLVKDEKVKELGAELRSVMLQTEQDILELTQHRVLGENNAILSRALQVRNPYVDCLNVLQAETLSRIRQFEEGQEDKMLKDALMTTIAGVANGMGNTG